MAFKQREVAKSFPIVWLGVPCRPCISYFPGFRDGCLGWTSLLPAGVRKGYSYSQQILSEEELQKFQEDLKEFSSAKCCYDLPAQKKGC